MEREVDLKGDFRRKIIRINDMVKADWRLQEVFCLLSGHGTIGCLRPSGLLSHSLEPSPYAWRHCLDQSWN